MPEGGHRREPSTRERSLGYDTATLERTTQTCRSDMWRTVCDDAICECGIEEARFGPIQVTVFEAQPDAPALNTVLGAAEPGAVEQGHLAAAIEWADGFDVDYRVPVARGRPGMAAAEAWLNSHGFEQGRALARYIRDATPPSQPGDPAITVWEIGEEDAAGETMAHLAAPALGLRGSAGSLLFSLPGQEHWRVYTAELEEEIVSFGSMLINGEIAWIGLDATAEKARRRGCNQALLRERILAAGEAGCETIFAELDESDAEQVPIAARNLIRAGFVPAHGSMSWRR
jgi:GNAT superfamily N-acetyltransferase